MWTDHRRTAQCSVEEAGLEDLVDFVNYLDEAENLLTIAVNACDLSTLATAVSGPSISVPSSCPELITLTCLMLFRLRLRNSHRLKRESH